MTLDPAIHMGTEMALALSGRGADLDPPIDRIRMVDDRTMVLWSSQDPLAQAIVTVGETLRLEGFTYSPLTEIEDMEGTDDG